MNGWRGSDGEAKGIISPFAGKVYTIRIANCYITGRNL